MIVHGWGNYSKLNSEVFFPDTLEKLRLNISTTKSLIGRGLGRSYGDSANNKYIIQMYSKNISKSISIKKLYELNKDTIDYSKIIKYFQTQ